MRNTGKREPVADASGGLHNAHSPPSVLDLQWVAIATTTATPHRRAVRCPGGGRQILSEFDVVTRSVLFGQRDLLHWGEGR